MATPATPTSANAPSSAVGNSATPGNISNANGIASMNAAASTSNVPPSVSSDVFVVGEKALCYHGPLVYEAKVLQTADYVKEPAPLTGEFGTHYFVHYKGWKRTWDEWVHARRLLKMNEQSLSLQKALNASHQSTAANSGSGTASNKAGSASGGGGSSKAGATGTSARVASGSRKDGRGQKRARDEERTEEMKLNVPEVLKQILVNDWENVTKHSQLVEVPTKPTVVEILANFSNYVMEMDPQPAHLKEPEKLLATITSGLQTYFDKSLGTNLLYRFERPQYAQIRKQFWTGQDVVVGVTEKEMSSIYGAEHLLRMLVSLPSMLAQSSLDRGSLDIIRDYTNELIQYMAQERDHIFQKGYLETGSTYSNVAKS